MKTRTAKQVMMSRCLNCFLDVQTRQGKFSKFNNTEIQTRYLLDIPISVNTASISIVFEHSRILKKMKVLFIVRFCFGKYSFSLNTYGSHLTF